MSMEYIRKTYGVPAKRGMQVRWRVRSGEWQVGTIVGSRGSYLRIRIDGFKYIGSYHPTYDLIYACDR